MSKIVGYDVISDDLVGAGGFLAIRRLRLRNQRDDGSRSDPYLCDFVVRPYGLDAVVVALFHRGPGGVEVLLREALRPPLTFGRAAEHTPIPDDRSYLYLTELVAGIIEQSDRGMDGLRHRAAAEALEEAGYRIAPGDVMVLGSACFPTPGAMAEKFWFTAAEVEDRGAQSPPAGDGSPMEEGAVITWRPLDEAIAACVRGDIEDVKTELTLRRLKDALASARTNVSGKHTP